VAESKRIGEILVDRGVIDDATAELIEAERLLMRSRFLSAAVANGRVSEADALTALAVRDGVPSVDLARAVLSTAVTKRVPQAVARRHVILAVREEGENLLVAMANPADRKVVAELSFATGLNVIPHAALHSRLMELIPKVYATSAPFFRGPLAPAEIGDEEHVPIVSDQARVPRGLDIEVVVDDDVLTIGEEAETAAPSAPEQRPAADARGKPAAAGERRVVLVVEDEPDIAKLITRTLSPLGYELIESGRGLEALHLIKQHRPALIILDAMLPEVHGFEICRKVKESKRFGSTPVLMISAIYRGWRIAEDIKATYKADAFLEKPFRVADLRRLAQRLLENQGAATAGDDAPASAEARALAQKGQQALADGDAAQALIELRQAESLEPFSAAIQFLIAQALEKRDRAFQAIYHYERAMELKPGFFAAARSAAVLYQSRGFKHKAAELWERALDCAPNQDLREQIKLHLMDLL
jgi:CheY-like chemotaxis protein